jgi:serine/threonine protein kinase/tetratricopeptide (TPR) repeat protein
VTIKGKQVCPVCGMLFSKSSEACPVCELRGALSPESDPHPVEEAASASLLRFEHYQVLQNEAGRPMELGRGAMGVTYKAVDVNLRRPVALKIINARLVGDASARHRFLREARAAASVRHPNVASVFHLGEIGGDYFYAMDFVDGETLESLVRRCGPLEFDLALEIVTQVAAGLTAIHKQHLVHRDIKPSNIMLSWEEDRLENAKIIDLGLAKGVSDDKLSFAGSFIGTPCYASPEQFAGLGTDIRSDLYSLGVTLWEMLSGKPPFQGSVAELMDQHQRAAPPLVKLRNIPEPIMALLDVLLAKDPSRRFQTPTQLPPAVARVREAITSGVGLTAEELRSVSAQVIANMPKRKPRRRAARWLLGAGLCLVGALIAWFSFLGHPGFLSNLGLNGTAPTEKSIAVLPFESLSDNKGDSYFADGVQDEILNNLAKIAQLKVISRTSVMHYRADPKPDLRQIANALGVTNVLEGTVRRDGNHVRVSTELIDARNDHTIWADSYDRDLTNIFAIQSEIAQTVASRLSAQLSPEERKDIEGRPTNNLEAYDLYLQAKQLIPRESSGLVSDVTERAAFNKGISLLEEATQKDPKFALAYCLITKAHDFLYDDQLDHTPERRALGDAAMNEALRLGPDLAEVHLAFALHLYTCYRDLERARVHIAIAARSLFNSSDLLELTARFDQVQGRWEQATAGLEKAVSLDPRNPELLQVLAWHYFDLRRFRDAERIQDRLIELEPDQPLLALIKAECAFSEKADLKRVRAAFEALPPSIRDDGWITTLLVYYAAMDRDFKTAHQIVEKSPKEELYLVGALVPRRCVDIWLEMVRGNHPTMEEFGPVREQLYRKVEADPTNADLLSALGCVDIALGRKQLAISEARRAVEMLPISQDALHGPNLVEHLARVYTWANEPDLALETLGPLTKIPCGISYAQLKLYPDWDPLRKDRRFDQLLAELAPRD